MLKALVTVCLVVPESAAWAVKLKLPVMTVCQDFEPSKAHRHTLISAWAMPSNTACLK